MRAIVVDQLGGADVLTPRDVPLPEPGPGQVRVRVAAAGVNFIDVYLRQGVYPTSVPYVPGSDGCGRVTALGAGVTGVAVGDRVGWMSAPGAYAEEVLVPAEAAVPVPAEVGDDVAAALMMQGATAHALVTDCRPVVAGETVVVHAAAGGVGGLLVQLATRRGARVIATCSPSKAHLAREAGAAEVLDYADDWSGRVRELTGGRGADAVFDGVGAATFDGSLACLRVRGMLVLFGGASGQVPPFDIQRLNRGGSLYLTRPTLWHYCQTREELLGRYADLFAWVAAGWLVVRIGGRYRLDDAAQAHRDLESRSTTGKLLLVP